jgi:hypothetical protein
MYQVVILLLMLMGCSLSQEATLNDYVPNQFTKADFAIYDSNDKSTLSIGMNREEVERFQTVRNAQYGSFFSEIIEKYGNSGLLDESATNISLTFIVEFENGEYVIKKSKTDVKNKANALTISANFYQKDKLSFLMIADYFYSYPES